MGFTYTHQVLCSLTESTQPWGPEGRGLLPEQAPGSRTSHKPLSAFTNPSCSQMQNVTEGQRMLPLSRDPKESTSETQSNSVESGEH